MLKCVAALLWLNRLTPPGAVTSRAQLSTVLTNPFDVVKTRLQAQVGAAELAGLAAATAAGRGGGGGSAADCLVAGRGSYGAAAGGGGATAGGSLRQGDEIECRFRGGTRWLPGKVLRERPDGTFDIR